MWRVCTRKQSARTSVLRQKTRANCRVVLVLTANSRRSRNKWRPGYGDCSIRHGVRLFSSATANGTGDIIYLHPQCVCVLEVFATPSEPRRCQLSTNARDNTKTRLCKGKVREKPFMNPSAPPLAAFFGQGVFTGVHSARSVIH